MSINIGKQYEYRKIMQSQKNHVKQYKRSVRKPKNYAISEKQYK